jgi:Tetratricopeptide repeat
VPRPLLGLGRRYILAAFDDRPVGLLSHADWLTLQPHAEALVNHTQSQGMNATPVALLANQFALFLHARADSAQAEPLMRRALVIDEASFGPGHPNVARDLGNLAALLKATSRLSEAEPLMRRALAIDEASLGPDHPIVAIRLGNLAEMLRDTNRALRGRTADAPCAGHR